MKYLKLVRENFGHSIIMMIGDGVTDMEACPPADAFIGTFLKKFYSTTLISNLLLNLFLLGFGGNVVREIVRANSSWFVTDFQDLIDVLVSDISKRGKNFKIIQEWKNFFCRK